MHSDCLGCLLYKDRLIARIVRNYTEVPPEQGGEIIP